MGAILGRLRHGRNLPHCIGWSPMPRLRRGPLAVTGPYAGRWTPVTVRRSAVLLALTDAGRRLVVAGEMDTADRRATGVLLFVEAESVD